MKENNQKTKDDFVEGALKQQLQKTEEEFAKLMQPPKYHESMEGKECVVCGHPMPNSRGMKLAQNFIRQAQIDAVKAFAEEIFPDIKKYRCGKHKRLVAKINNLLKDI